MFTWDPSLNLTCFFLLTSDAHVLEIFSVLGIFLWVLLGHLPWVLSFHNRFVLDLYYTGLLVTGIQDKLSWDLSGHVSKSSSRSRASGMSVLNVTRTPLLHLSSISILSYWLYPCSLASSIWLDMLLVVFMPPNLYLLYSQFQLRNFKDSGFG